MKKFALLLIVASLLICGCNGGKVGLGGRVTYSDDGSPLTQGTICFEEGGYLARGNIEADGKFTVASTGKKDGLPPGNYQVYITGTTKMEGFGPDMTVTPLVDAKYANATSSGLSIKVDASTKRYDFKVDRPE